MKDTVQCPQYIMDRDGITKSQWRKKKRAELLAAIRAMDVLRYGCAYTPTAGVRVGELCNYLWYFILMCVAMACSLVVFYYASRAVLHMVGGWL